SAAEDVDVWHRHGHAAPVTCSTNPVVCPGSGAVERPLCSASAARGVRHKGAHVGMAGDSGPMPGKDSAAVVVLLAEPQSSHTGALESEVEAADSREEG